jgi:hypothetical protein
MLNFIKNFILVINHFAEEIKEKQRQEKWDRTIGAEQRRERHRKIVERMKAEKNLNNNNQ